MDRRLESQSNQLPEFHITQISYYSNFADAARQKLANFLPINQKIPQINRISNFASYQYYQKNKNKQGTSNQDL